MFIANMYCPFSQIVKLSSPKLSYGPQFTVYYYEFKIWKRIGFLNQFYSYQTKHNFLLVVTRGTEIKDFFFFSTKFQGNCKWKFRKKEAIMLHIVENMMLSSLLDSFAPWSFLEQGQLKYLHPIKTPNILL